MTFRDRLIQGLRQLLGGSEGATLTHSSNAPPLERPIPERLGRFRVVSKLGQGGMGVVYAARNDELDRSVAIKVIAATRTCPRASPIRST